MTEPTDVEIHEVAPGDIELQYPFLLPFLFSQLECLEWPDGQVTLGVQREDNILSQNKASFIWEITIVKCVCASSK